jgi:hypothetical protein
MSDFGVGAGQGRGAWGFALGCVWLFAASCGASPEGTNAGECGDNADNDRDGLVDCFDDSCATSAECGNGTFEGATDGECADTIDNDDDGDVDCEDEDCGTFPECDGRELPDDGECQDGDDNDGDGDIDCADADCATLGACSDDNDGGPFVHDGLTTVDLTFSLQIKIRVLGTAEDSENPNCNDIFNLCDCTLQFAGTGTLVESGGVRGTFEGTYERVGSDCNPMLNGSVYPANANTGITVYHTFRWSQDGSKLQEWIVHQDPTDITAIPIADSPKDNNQFYIQQMNASYQGTSEATTYLETDSEDQQDALITIYTVSDLSVNFQ